MFHEGKNMRDIDFKAIQEDPSYEEERAYWDGSMVRAGFHGNVNRLWDAFVTVRQGPWAGKSALEIMADPVEVPKFCDAVRSIVRDPISDKIIVAGLQAMPQRCAFCETVGWECCDECGGCRDCCDVDMHCPDCGWPAGLCGEPCDSCGTPLQPEP
jgi:hypothetical protein